MIVGDGACGKTSLLCFFALAEFPRKHVSTFILWVLLLVQENRGYDERMGDMTKGRGHDEKTRDRGCHNAMGNMTK